MHSPLGTKRPSLAAQISAVISTILLFAGGALAGSSPDLEPPPAANSGDAPWMQPLFGTGFKTNDAYTDGNIFITAPLWSTLGRNGTLGGDYLFLEPYTSLGDERQVTTSMGLGWRHLFSNEPRSALQKQGVAGFLDEGWFVGGNLFGDMLDTQNHNTFWQMGFGGEIGSRYLEFDGNYYCPLTGEKLASSDASTQTFTSSATNAQTTYGAPFATGNSVMQPYSTITTTTTSTTTAHTITDIYEEGMRGWDAQAVVLVPWVDQWVDFRLNGGYLRFDNQPLGPQGGPTGPVHGWKAGAELRPVPAIVLGGEWYEDERFAGANWVVSLEFQIPLDRDWMDAFKPRRRHLVEHLAEPVHRQNDAIKIGNSTTQQTTMTVAHNTTQTTMNAEQLLKADIVFVNNGGAVGNGIQAGSASGNGTAQNPFSTIQAGANLAGANSTSTGSLWTTYVQGGGPTYTETVNTVGSTFYLGSSQPIQGFGGKAFGGAGPNPVINGDIVADATMNPAIKTVGIQGFTIQNGDLVNEIAPISITDVKTVSITNNVIQNSTGDGIDVTVDNSLGALSGTVFIAGNTITNPTFAGVSLMANDGGAVLTGVVKDNIISGAQGDGIDLLATGSGKGGGTGAQITANITGNTILSPAGYGVYVEIDNNGTTGTVIVNNNTITNAGIAGIAANSFGASTLTLSASNNSITNPVVGFDITSNDNSTLNFTASGNQIANPTEYGILLNSGDASSLNANLTGNTITNALQNGIEIDANNTTSGTGVSLSITDNTVTGSPFDANVIFLASNSASVTVAMSDNSLIGPSSYNLYFAGGGSASITATVNNNNMSGASNGIFLASTGTANVSLDAIGNNITSPSQNGITFYTATNATASLTAIGNTFTSTINGYPGIMISLAAYNSSSATFNISGNQINGGYVGVQMQVMNSATLTGSLTGNTITQNFNYGIEGQTYESGALNLSINQNTLSYDGGLGITLQQTSSSTISVNTAATLINNTVTGDTQWMTNSASIPSSLSGSIILNGNTYVLPANAP